MNAWEKRRKSTHSFQCRQQHRGGSESSNMWRYCSLFAGNEMDNVNNKAMLGARWSLVDGRVCWQWLRCFKHCKWSASPLRPPSMMYHENRNLQLEQHLFGFFYKVSRPKAVAFCLTGMCHGVCGTTQDHPDTCFGAETERKTGKLHKEMPQSTLRCLNPAPSCCEVTVLTSDPACHCLGSWWCVGLNNYHFKRLDDTDSCLLNVYLHHAFSSTAVQPMISDVWKEVKRSTQDGSYGAKYQDMKRLYEEAWAECLCPWCPFNFLADKNP